MSARSLDPFSVSIPVVISINLTILNTHIHWGLQIFSVQLRSSLNSKLIYSAAYSISGPIWGLNIPQNKFLIIFHLLPPQSFSFQLLASPFLNIQVKTSQSSSTPLSITYFFPSVRDLLGLSSKYIPKGSFPVTMGDLIKPALTTKNYWSKYFFKSES